MMGPSALGSKMLSQQDWFGPQLCHPPIPIHYETGIMLPGYAPRIRTDSYLPRSTGQSQFRPHGRGSMQRGSAKPPPSAFPTWAATV